MYSQACCTMVAWPTHAQASGCVTSCARCPAWASIRCAGGASQPDTDVRAFPCVLPEPQQSLRQIVRILQVPGALHGAFIPGTGLPPDRCKGAAARLQSIQGRADAAVVRADGCVRAQQQVIGVVAGRFLLHKADRLAPFT